MKFSNYLNEKTFAIGKDVDLIYNLYLKEAINLYKKTTIIDFMHYITSSKRGKAKGEYIFGETTTEILKSKQCQKAHKLNPCTIQVGVFGDGNFYSPVRKIISISLNVYALQLLLKCSNKEELKKSIIDPNQRKMFESEFTGTALKATIYHELSHWLNDTFHNYNISNKIHLAKIKEDPSVLKKSGYSNFTDFEIDAQIHAIKQLKRKYNKTWDDLTWTDIMLLKPSFSVIKTQLKSSSKKVRDEYMKNMYKRLNREKLLGKNMKNSFNKFLSEEITTPTVGNLDADSVTSNKKLKLKLSDDKIKKLVKYIQTKNDTKVNINNGIADIDFNYEIPKKLMKALSLYTL